MNELNDAFMVVAGERILDLCWLNEDRLQPDQHFQLVTKNYILRFWANDIAAGLDELRERMPQEE